MDMENPAVDGQRLAFRLCDHPSRVIESERRKLLADPGFGRVFSDHMVIVPYNADRGWHDAEIRPFGPLALSPAAAVLHYAQEIFEGMKAYRHADGRVVLFRPEANARRFNSSAARLAMPPVPEGLFVEAVSQLVWADREWIPDGAEASLYLRPFMFADEAFLGVRPSASYQFVVIASPVGAYFRGAPKAVTVWASEHYTRAALGGTGAVKCGGNYAAGLLAQAEATAHGCDQVVFLDAAERRWIEELGGMNIYFAFGDGRLVTPPLGGTLLPGVTRDAILNLAAARGLRVSEERYSLEQWRADVASGNLAEAFACGTAAVVTSIGRLKTGTGDLVMGDGGAGPVAQGLRQALVDIQRGQAPDPYGWVHEVTQPHGGAPA